MVVGFISFFLALVVSSTHGADPVKLSVYYESLCPDSKEFVIHQMYPVWKDLKDIMTMDINTYGKASDTPSGDGYVFECQHGPEECAGNMMLTCAKNHMNEEEYLAFSNCIMEAFSGIEAGSICAEVVGVDYAITEDCLNSLEGQQLQHEVGLVQSTLDPPLNYVPWILINDVYNDDQLSEAQEDLRSVICNAYEGEKPPKCNL